MADTEQPTASDETSLEEAMAQVFGEEPKPEAKSGDSPADKTEEKVAEKKPDDERVSKRIAAAHRAEARASRTREELRAQQAQLEKAKAEVSELLELAAKARSAKASPSKLLELSGLDPKSFLEALATEHEPASVARRIADEGLSEVEKLKAQVSALEKERENEKRSVTSHRLNSDVRAAQAQFIDHVADNASRYPTLTEDFTPEEIASQALGLAEQHAAAYFRKFGVYPDDEVIAEHLESQAKARAEARGAWRERIGQRAKPSEGAFTGGKQQSRTDSRGNGPRTLTSRATSERASGKKAWSQEEADEESIRILNGAFR